MNSLIPSQKATAEELTDDQIDALWERHMHTWAGSGCFCDYNLRMVVRWAIEADRRLRPPTPAADQQTERRALGELVEADTALQAWCAAKRAEPKAPFDPMASISSAGFTFKKEPEHDAIIGRLNKAWDSARAACFAGGSPARDVEAPAATGTGAWIDIKVRRPELFEKVLLLGTYYSENTAVVGVMDSAIGDFDPTFVMDPSPHEAEYDKAEIWNVTHWMPLPAAPIGSDK